MRVAEDTVLALGQVDIDDVELGPKSRDDLPAVLLGIQFIHRDADLLEKIVNLLSSHLLQGREADASCDRTRKDGRKVDPDVGRPGMSHWCLLVLAILKRALKCDYDRLHELGFRHLDVRRMLGLSDVISGPEFFYRTVVRNVSLLAPQLPEEINQLVDRAGHSSLGREPEQPLQARRNSFFKRESNSSIPAIHARIGPGRAASPPL